MLLLTPQAKWRYSQSPLKAKKTILLTLVKEVTTAPAYSQDYKGINQKELTMLNTTYQLETLTCPSCIKKIEGALGVQSGVETVKVLFNSSKVKVSHDETVNADDLKQLIEELGYEVISEK